MNLLPEINQSVSEYIAKDTSALGCRHRIYSNTIGAEIFEQPGCVLGLRRHQSHTLAGFVLVALGGGRGRFSMIWLFHTLGAIFFSRALGGS